jgi:hypothetical protein
MHCVVANESSAFLEFIIGQIGFASTVFVRFEICFALLLVYSRRRIKMFQRCYVLFVTKIPYLRVHQFSIF